MNRDGQWASSEMKRMRAMSDYASFLALKQPPGEERMTTSITVPPENGTFIGVDNASYHADTTSLSSSGARLLLPPSCPAKFRQRMDSPPEYKQVFDFGTVTHGLVLGEGGTFSVVDAPDYRSKAAQTERDQIRKDGKTPILAGELERATAMAATVYVHPLAGELLMAKGESEVSWYANDPVTGTRLRARPDRVTTDYEPGRLWIVDYKTTITAAPSDFSRRAADYGYHFQAAWYRLVAKLLGLDPNPRFIFIAQEKEAPYLVSVVEFDDEAIEEGDRLVRQAIDTYAHCMETGQWPGYDEGITQMSLPPWKFQSEQEEIVIA
jgi:hypothetical protein